MKIAFIAGNLGQGGAERQLFNILALLKSEKVDVDLFCFETGGFWKGPIEKLGVKITYIYGKTRICRLLSLIVHLSNGQYNFIHSQHFYTNLYAFVVGLICGVNSVGASRSDVIAEVSEMGILGWLSLWLPTKLAANSHAGVRKAVQLSRKADTVFFLPNFIDTQVFFPNLLREHNSVFRVIVVGTIRKPKRIDRVVDIAEIISKRSNNKIVLEIIGDGDLLSFYIAYAESKNVLNSTVFFKGRINNIAEEYRLADALLLTSDYEGTPNVILEAMASGLPVVSTPVGDVPEIVIHGSTGFVINFDEMEKIADSIEFLANNRQESIKMGGRARMFVCKNYSLEKLRKELLNLYSLDSVVLQGELK